MEGVVTADQQQHQQPFEAAVDGTTEGQQASDAERYPFDPYTFGYAETGEDQGQEEGGEDEQSEYHAQDVAHELAPGQEELGVGEVDSEQVQHYEEQGQQEVELQQEHEGQDGELMHEEQVIEAEGEGDAVQVHGQDHDAIVYEEEQPHVEEEAPHHNNTAHPHLGAAGEVLSNGDAVPTINAPEGDGGEQEYGVQAGEPEAAQEADAQQAPSGGKQASSLSVPHKKETPYSRSPELRVSHKLAERKRRKDMKTLFDELRVILPDDKGPKTSKGDILSNAIYMIRKGAAVQDRDRTELELLRNEIVKLGGSVPEPPPLEFSESAARGESLVDGQEQQEQTQAQAEGETEAQPQDESMVDASQSYEKGDAQDESMMDGEQQQQQQQQQAAGQEAVEDGQELQDQTMQEGEVRQGEEQAYEDVAAAAAAQHEQQEVMVEEMTEEEAAAAAAAQQQQQEEAANFFASAAGAQVGVPEAGEGEQEQGEGMEEEGVQEQQVYEENVEQHGQAEYEGQQEEYAQEDAGQAYALDEHGDLQGHEHEHEHEHEMQDHHEQGLHALAQDALGQQQQDGLEPLEEQQQGQQDEEQVAMAQQAANEAAGHNAIYMPS